MRDQLLKNALAQIEATDNHEEKAARLTELGPHLSPRQLREALSYLRFANDNIAAIQLEALAPWTAPNLPKETLNAVHLITDLNVRTAVLKALAPYWKKNDRTTVAAEAATRHLSSEEFRIKMGAANSMESASDRSLAYSRLAPKLNDEQLSAVLMEISKIGDEHARMTLIRGPDGFGALLDHLGKRLPDELLATVGTFRDEQSRAPVIWSLSRVLPRAYLKRLLAAAAELKDDRLRALIFGEGSTATLMQAEPEASVALALSVENDAALASALHSIAFYEVPSHLVEAIISAASRLKEEEVRSLLFALLSKTTLSEEQRIRALESMSVIVDKVQLTEMFAALGRPVALAASTAGAQIGAGRRKVRAKLAVVGEKGRLSPKNVEQNLFADKMVALGSRGQTKNKETNTGEQTAGRLQKEHEKLRSHEMRTAIKAFLLSSGVPDKNIDEDVIADFELLLAKATVKGSPKWNDRNSYKELRELKNALLFLRKVYGDFVDSDKRMPDGRLIWQEAVRANDARIIQVVQTYQNERTKSRGGLDEAKTVTFGNSDARGRPKKARKKAQQKAPRHG